MLSGLQGKPWYFGLIVGLVIGGVLFALIWFRFIQPTREQIEAQQARIESLEREIAKGRAAKENLERFEQEVAQLEQELRKLLRILPARRNVHELIRRVRLLAERGDFNLRRFRPSNEQERDFYSEWPITIELDGSYHNLALFFDRISRFSRIINIDNLTVKAIQRGNTNHSIGASFTAKTFIYKEPEEETSAVEGNEGNEGNER